jgi:glycosyltransferase involved in cell wall biosynthesis
MKVLQTQQPSTPPFSAHACNVRNNLTRIEIWLGKLLPDFACMAFSLWLRRNRYDWVITSDYRTSFLYGALRNLLGGKSFHMVKELYLDERTLGSRVRKALFSWALCHCDCLVTNCSAEVAAYGAFLNLAPERVHFLPWPSNLPAQTDVADDGYVFAAGRSWRDWQVLLHAADRVAARFVVVAERSALAGLRIPGNVALHCDVDRKQYLDFLRGARVVAVPVRATVRSVGQAVILEAMAFAKPIVAARVPGILDYVRAGETGLYYEPGDAGSLVDRLNHLLADPALRARLGDEARAAVQTRFNKARYSEAMLALTVGVAAGRNEARHQARQDRVAPGYLPDGLTKGAA